MIDVILQAFASIVLDPVTLGLMLIGTLAGIFSIVNFEQRNNDNDKLEPKQTKFSGTKTLFILTYW